MTQILGFSHAGAPLTINTPLSDGWFYSKKPDKWVELKATLLDTGMLLRMGYTRYSAHRPDSVSGGGRQGILTPTPVDLERELKTLREDHKVVCDARMKDALRLGEQLGDITALKLDNANLRLELDSTKMLLETAQNKLAAITCIIRPDPKALTNEQRGCAEARRRRITGRASRAISWAASEPS